MKYGHGYSIDNYNSSRTDEAKIKCLERHLKWLKRKHDEVVDNIDYSFEILIEGSQIQDTQIIDYEIIDSKW